MWCTCRWRGRRDWDVARHAWKHDFVLVTNNADDFREIYGQIDLHSGLVIVIPSVRLDLQRELFSAALGFLVREGEPINQVLEVDLEGEEISLRISDLSGNDPSQIRETACLG